MPQRSRCAATCARSSRATGFCSNRWCGMCWRSVADGPVVDLYAGVGLFGLALAALRVPDVTLVEGDPVSGADLQANARAVSRSRASRAPERRGVSRRRRSLRDGGHGHRRSAAHRTVEGRGVAASSKAKPGRSSMCRATWRRWRAMRACFSTLATSSAVTGLDLFPNTAHVETVVQFVRCSQLESIRGRTLGRVDNEHARSGHARIRVSARAVPAEQ